jgi:hypothetical protein
MRRPIPGLVMTVRCMFAWKSSGRRMHHVQTLCLPASACCRSEPQACVQLDIRARLDSRRRATPAEFAATMALQVHDPGQGAPGLALSGGLRSVTSLLAFGGSLFGLLRLY